MISGMVLALIFVAIAWAIKADKEAKSNPSKKKGRSIANVIMAIVFLLLILAGFLGFLSGGKVF